MYPFLSCLAAASSQGSRAGLEFKAGLEKALNFKTPKKSLNCFWKWKEGLEKFEI